MNITRRSNFLFGSTPDFPEGIAVKIIHCEVGSLLCIVEKSKVEHKLSQTLQREFAIEEPPHPGLSR